MINASEEAFSGSVELESVELEREPPTIKVEHAQTKEADDEGKEYTYKIYPPATELIFNDVGIDSSLLWKLLNRD